MNSKNYTKQLTFIKVEKIQGCKEAGQKVQVINHEQSAIV